MAEECIEMSPLDGFLTGLVIGPEMIVPSLWLPDIWGETEGDEMVWESPEQLECILGLIMAHDNHIARIFHTDPNQFAPVLYFIEEAGQEITFIDLWCIGFLQAVNLNLDSWQPIIQSEEFGHLLLPFYLNGTERRQYRLENDPELREIPHDVWIETLYEFISLIHKFWHFYRDTKKSTQERVATPTTGRNDPCPCGEFIDYSRLRSRLYRASLGWLFQFYHGSWFRFQGLPVPSP